MYGNFELTLQIEVRLQFMHLILVREMLNSIGSERKVVDSAAPRGAPSVRFYILDKIATRSNKRLDGKRCF